MASFFSRPLMADERKYTFRSYPDIEQKSGLIGYAQIDMPSTYADASKRWYTVNAKLDTTTFRSDFKYVFSRIINILSSKEHLRVYYNTNLSLTFTNGKNSFVGMRVLTDKYIYLVRVNPCGITDNILVFCYMQESLTRHIKNAMKGIRFVNKENREVFTIRDGEGITIEPSYDKSPVICRYIDPLNCRIGTKKWNLNEFAVFIANSERVIAPVKK